MVVTGTTRALRDLDCRVVSAVLVVTVELWVTAVLVATAVVVRSVPSDLTV